MVGTVLAAFVAVGAVATHDVLAGSGGDPASAAVSLPAQARTRVVAQAGDTLWFDSRTPHRSGPNRSSSPRRALYPTYNAAAEGDLRAAYYRRKADELAGAEARHDRVPVSLIGDFQGRPVR